MGGNYRSRRSTTWKYYNLMDDFNKIAQCKICSNTLSFKSTITNLRNHLRKKHFDSFKQLLEEGNEKIDEQSDEEAKEEETSVDVDSDFAGYFEQSGGLLRCVVCRDPVDPTSEALREHLSKHHPRLLDDSDEDENEQRTEDDMLYTEVVYLEDQQQSGDEAAAPENCRKRKGTDDNRTSEAPKRQNTEYLWDHFHRPADEPKVGYCGYCTKKLSFRTTIANLKQHLRVKHPDAYKAYLDSCNRTDIVVKSPPIVRSRRAPSQESDESQSIQIIQIQRALSQESDEPQTVQVQVIPTRLVPSQESDGSQSLQVIPTRNAPSQESDGSQAVQVENSNNRRLLSAPSSSASARQKSADDEEIESFGAYITCLLKSLPKDVCTAVQRDIVALIVNVKLKKPQVVENLNENTNTVVEEEKEDGNEGDKIEYNITISDIVCENDEDITNASD